jgi:precorrin-4/cobalt-precorrin-4 C11-methyltransferase
VFRASWPDERVLRGTLATIAEAVRSSGLERTALILVGPALAAEDFGESALYATGYDRRFRPGGGQ